VKDSLDNDFYETVCRMSPVGLFRTDVNGLLVYVSDKFQDIVNLNHEDLMGQSWMKSIHSEDYKDVVTSFREAVRTESNWNIEFRFRTKEKKVTWVLGQASRINGGGKGLVGTITNLHKKKSFLTELETMRKSFTTK